MFKKLRSKYYELTNDNYGLCMQCKNYFGNINLRPYTKCKECDWIKKEGNIGIDNWQPK